MPVKATLSTTARGAAVESGARQYLQAAGLQYLANNVRFRVGELDLIMYDPATDTLVFVEVRYRRHSDYGGGAASVDGRKCRKLMQAAQLWLANQPDYAAMPCRFDVVEASGEPPQFHWIKDAFRVEDV